MRLYIINKTTDNMSDHQTMDGSVIAAFKKCICDEVNEVLRQFWEEMCVSAMGKF